jgi:hypothetical protein
MIAMLKQQGGQRLSSSLRTCETNPLVRSIGHAGSDLVYKTFTEA